jgi:hypothetical protein
MQSLSLIKDSLELILVVLPLFAARWKSSPSRPAAEPVRITGRYIRRSRRARR